LVFGKISITQKWFKKFEICVENFNTSLYINVKCENHFCGFLEDLWEFLELKRTCFPVPELALPGSVGRPHGRPDQDRTVDRTRSRSTVAIDRRAQGRARWLPFKPVDRTIDRLRATHSRVAPDRPSGRPDRDRCSLFLGPVDPAVDR